MLVTIQPPGREEYKLEIDGAPTFSSQQFGGYEQAQVGVELDDEQRVNCLGGRLRIHGETGIVWQGIITRRPSRGDPLLAKGWGWCGDQIRRKALFARTDFFGDLNDLARTDLNSAAFDIRNAGGVLTMGIAPGSAVVANNQGGYYYFDDVELKRMVFRADVAHANVSLIVYSSSAEKARTTAAYTQTASGAATGSATFSAGMYGFVIVCNADTSVTPTDSLQYCLFYTSPGSVSAIVYGISASATTYNIIDDILTNEIDTDYLPSGSGYRAWIANDTTEFENLYFDHSTANDKIEEIAKYSAYSWQWRMENVAGVPYCVPHWEALSTTPDYIINLDAPNVLASDMDEASIDDLYSDVRSLYQDEYGHTRYKNVSSSSMDNPLVALGITRYGYVQTTTTSSATASAIGEVFLADVGRQQVQGSIIVDALMTVYGADVYLPDVVCGRMVRVMGTALPNGYYDCIVRRVRCLGDKQATIELDNAPYALDILLARLSQGA